MVLFYFTFFYSFEVPGSNALEKLYLKKKKKLMNSFIPFGNLCVFVGGILHPTPSLRSKAPLLDQGTNQVLEIATLSPPSLQTGGSLGFLDLGSCVPPLSPRWSRGGPRPLSQAPTFVGFLRKDC